MAHSYVLTENDRENARRLFYRAIELDPGYATAHGMAVRTYADRPSFDHTDADKAEIRRLASRVSAIGHDDALALCWAGFGLFRVHDDDAGMAMMDQALAFNQNLAAGWFVRGWCRLYRGEHELGLEELTRAKRLSPLDPDVYRTDSGIAFAHLFQGRYDEALNWAHKSRTRMPTWMPALRAAAAANALGGSIDEARKVAVRMRQLEPARTISHLKAFLPYRRPEDLARVIEGLRLAGLPE